MCLYKFELLDGIELTRNNNFLQSGYIVLAIFSFFSLQMIQRLIWEVCYLVFQVLNNTLSPVWNQTFDFVVEDGLHELVIFEVYDHDTFGKVMHRS